QPPQGCCRVGGRGVQLSQAEPGTGQANGTGTGTVPGRGPGRMSLSLFENLRHHAELTPTRPAILNTTESWSYQELQQGVLELSDWLKRQSVQVVALLADNGPSWTLVDLA